MKKSVLILCIYLFSFLVTFSQTPEWLWAKKVNSTGYNYAAGICTDGNGNSYIAGNFLGDSLLFDSILLIDSNATGLEGDIFLAKYNASGNVIWAKCVLGPGPELVRDICTDPMGNVYITGYFGSPEIKFDTITLANDTTNGSIDVFVVKYDSAGTVIWAKSAGNTAITSGISICADENSNIYVAGDFLGNNIVFGAFTLTNSPSNRSNVFIVKYDIDGNVMWAKKGSGTLNEATTDVYSDLKGNVYFAGYYFSTSITFESTILANNTPGKADIFIAKYDTSGALLWAKGAGGNKNDYSAGLGVDLNKNVYVAGNYDSDAISFASDVLLPSDGDIFIFKYGEDGNEIKAISTGQGAALAGMTIDSSGNIYLCGNSSNDLLTFGNVTLQGPGSNIVNGFVVEYDSTFTALWGINPTGSGSALIDDICVDINDNVLITGQISGLNIIFGNTIFAPTGFGDTYVAKIDNTTSIESLENINTTRIYPNPAQNKLTITTEEEITSYTIADVSGRIMHSVGINNQIIFDIDVSLLSSGIYYLKLETEKEIGVKKFVKD